MLPLSGTAQQKRSGIAAATAQQPVPPMLWAREADGVRVDRKLGAELIQQRRQRADGLHPAARLPRKLRHDDVCGNVPEPSVGEVLGKAVAFQSAAKGRRPWRCRRAGRTINGKPSASAAPAGARSK